MKYLPLVILMALASCRQVPSPNRFADAELIRIHSLQDRRNTDSLLFYLSHTNPTYRKAAALAFASVQDSLAVTALAERLRDDAVEVREATAYALGQTRCAQSEQVLLGTISTEKDNRVLRQALEAFGKVASAKTADNLASFTTVDSVALTGKAWGIYRLGLRRVTTDSVIRTAALLLASESVSVRLAAAHFFARTPLKDFIDSQEFLRRAASDSNVFVRMAATTGLRNLKTEESKILLQKNVGDGDERVRANALRALRAFPFADVRDTYLTALNDGSLQVQVAAAEAMINQATPEAFDKIVTAANSAQNWRVQATLYEIAATQQPTPELFATIRAQYDISTNSYQQAALLNVFGRSAANADFIGMQLVSATDPVVISSAASSLTACNSAADFTEKDKPLLLQWYTKAIEKGDAAVTGIIAQVLGDSTKNYKPLVRDVTFLREARSKLSLPKDNESIQPLEAALAYLEGREAEPVLNSFNHPIDWALVATIPTGQRVIVKTSQGDITLELFVDEAPGSVANFVSLARKDYFDNKFFHRVVPNFVIQAGCNRGDGYGSEDYSIRSEFGDHRYTSGSVGMASAGKDTEGTQWFITHSPTPHLDGSYTVFAEVRDGMDVVNAIGVGDKILDVVIE